MTKEVDDISLSAKDEDDNSTCPSCGEDNHPNLSETVAETAKNEKVGKISPVRFFAPSRAVEVDQMAKTLEVQNTKHTESIDVDELAKTVENVKDRLEKEAAKCGKADPQLYPHDQGNIPEDYFNSQDRFPSQSEFLPSPMPEGPDQGLSTVALRRHTRGVVPPAVPGAQHMEGFGPVSRARTAPSTDEGTVPAPTEQDAAGAESNDENENVIGSAFLVNDDEELGMADPPAFGQGQGDSEVIIGQALPETVKQKQKKCQTWQFLSVLAVVLGAGIFAVVFLARGQGDNSDGATKESASGQKDEPILYPPFQENLPKLTLNLMNEVGGAIYLGNKWMNLDPMLHTYSEERQRQRYILACLYYGLGGPNWTNNDGWLDYTVSECDWYSNSRLDMLKDKPVCDEDNNLLMMNVADNNLQGEIPDMSSFHSIPFVPHLWSLDFAHNNITGATPALFSGTAVEIVSISNNSFTGLHPSSGMAGETIRYLLVDSNQIEMTASGVAWYALPNLEVYNVTGNRIGGILGPQIKTANHMTYVGAGHNPWGSTIPSEIGLLSDLIELDLSGNVNMGGSVPTELGLLQNLKWVDLRGSNYTGDLPPQFCVKDNETGTVRVEVLADCSKINCCQLA